MIVGIDKKNNIAYDRSNPFKLNKSKLIPLQLLDVLEIKTDHKRNMLFWEDIQKKYGGKIINNATLYQFYMENAFNGFVMTKEDIRNITRNIRIIHNWNVYKQVYKFDDDWFKYLHENFNFSKTIPLSLLATKLPYSSFYIDNPCEITGDKFNGIFVDITDETTYEWGNAYKTLTTCFVIDDEEFGSTYSCIPLRDDLTLEDLFNRIKGTIEDENELGHFICLKIVVALCMYLCADNKDIEIRKGNTPKENYELKKVAKKGVKQASIGIRIGNTIRENKVKYVYEGNEHNKGSKKSPHIRGGHYHHFWVGKKDGSEERKLILHYIEPTFIGGSVEKTTIHRVKK